MSLLPLTYLYNDDNRYHQLVTFLACSVFQANHPSMSGSDGYHLVRLPVYTVAVCAVGCLSPLL
jgi:hypothetical protein